METGEPRAGGGEVFLAPAAIQYLSSFLRGNGKHATHEHVLTLVQGC